MCATYVPSKCEAGSQDRCKNLANRRERGATWGPIPLGRGGPRGRKTGSCIYIYTYNHTIL